MSKLRSFRDKLVQLLFGTGRLIPDSDVREVVKRNSDAVISVNSSDVTVARWTKTNSSQHPGLNQQLQLLRPDEQMRTSDRILVVFGPDTTFSHGVKVPKPSLANARKILELELSRLMPFVELSLLRFQWLSEDGNTAHQAVVKRSSLDAALSMVKNARAKIVALGVLQNDGHIAPAFITSTGEDYVAVREKPWKQALTIAASGFIATSLVVSFQAVKQYYETEKVLLEDMTRLAAAAKGVRLELDQFESKRKLSADINALRVQSPSVGAVWQELTNLLPDKSWVQQLSYNGELFQIEGVSGDAAKLVPILEGSKLLKDVAFNAAVTQSIVANTQRFSIRFRIEMQQ